MTETPPVRAAVEDRVMLQEIAAGMFGDVAPPRVGLGRYVILDRIGAGGMGVVLKAYDPQLGRKVALKVLRPDWAVDSAARARLEREAIALAKLAHPNVVAIHEVAHDSDELFLVMEFVDGVDLATWAREHAGASDDARALLVQAGEGLAAAHRQGLLHRDFKPSNVLIGTDERARVADFGLAKRSGSSTATGTASSAATPISAAHAGATPEGTATLGGTPLYMSPEQQAGAELTAASDQFSFCVTAWEVLFGARPWPGPPDAAAPPPPPAGAPGWLVNLLLRGLAEDPGERHPSMEDLVRALRRDPTRRRRVGVAAVVLAGLGALGLQQWATRCDDGPRALAQVMDGQDAARLDAFAARWRDAYRPACRDGREAALGCLAFARTKLDVALESGNVDLDALPDPTHCEYAPAAMSLGRDGARALAAFAAIERASADGSPEPSVDTDHPVVSTALLELRSDRAHAGGDPNAANDFAREGYRTALTNGLDPAAARFATRLAVQADGYAATLWTDHATLLAEDD